MSGAGFQIAGAEDHAGEILNGFGSVLGMAAFAAGNVGGGSGGYGGFGHSRGFTAGGFARNAPPGHTGDDPRFWPGPFPPYVVGAPHPHGHGHGHGGHGGHGHVRGGRGGFGGFYGDGDVVNYNVLPTCAPGEVFDPYTAACYVVSGAMAGDPRARAFLFRTGELAARGSRSHQATGAVLLAATRAMGKPGLAQAKAVTVPTRAPLATAVAPHLAFSPISAAVTAPTPFIPGAGLPQGPPIALPPAPPVFVPPPPPPAPTFAGPGADPFASLMPSAMPSVAPPPSGGADVYGEATWGTPSGAGIPYNDPSAVDPSAWASWGVDVQAPSWGNETWGTPSGDGQAYTSPEAIDASAWTPPFPGGNGTTDAWGVPSGNNQPYLDPTFEDPSAWAPSASADDWFRQSYALETGDTSMWNDWASAGAAPNPRRIPALRSPLEAAQKVVQGARRGDPRALGFVQRSVGLAAQGSPKHRQTVGILTHAAKLEDLNAHVAHYGRVHQRIRRAHAAGLVPLNNGPVYWAAPPGSVAPPHAVYVAPTGYDPDGQQMRGLTDNYGSLLYGLGELS